MEEQSLYDFYKFGWEFNFMVRGFPKNPIKHAQSSFNGFSSFIVSNNMLVTKSAMEPDFTTLSKKIHAIAPNTVISDELSNEIAKFSKGIEKTLDAELGLREAYVLTKKRLGLSSLLKNPSALFSAGTFTLLSTFAKRDLSEAGKCIAFERYTAAAFHLLRGTEQILKEYYIFKVKKNRVKKLFWYDMTENLRGKSNVPDSLIAVLDSIREDFRNPTAHPEKTYGEDEVQSLFTHCVDVIDRLTRLMK